MCIGRLKNRCPSCQPLLIAKLEKYVFKFHKISNDGSGKGNVFFTNKDEDAVWGIVFLIANNDEKNLDKAEGKGEGYHDEMIDVKDKQNNIYQVKIYKADSDSIDEKLKPYSWYKRFVIEGAKYNGLPGDYIKIIDQFESIEDTDKIRENKNLIIQCK